MIRFADKSTFIFSSRVSEFFLYHVLKHLHRTKLWEIDRNLYIKIIRATCTFLPMDELMSLSNFFGQDVSLHLSSDDNWYGIFDFMECNSFLHYSHFKCNFPIEQYIMHKMNYVYWSKIDQNLKNAIKYRHRENTSYQKNINNIAKGIKNVSKIDSVSYLLFLRYRYALEPYFILNSLLNNLLPIMKVKFYISKESRSCTFGEKCRSGHAFVACQMSNGVKDYKLDYCLCNKHLNELKSQEFKINFNAKKQPRDPR